MPKRFRPRLGRRRLLAACLLAPALTPAALAQEATDTIPIGFAGPLSGSSAKVGQSQLHAVELALQEINARAPRLNGRRIAYKLVIGDDRGDAQTAALIAEYLVRTRVAAVIGHWNTAASLAAAPLYAAAGIPQVAAGSSGRQYTANGLAGSFRIIGHDDDGGAYAGSYVARVLDVRRVAVIDDDTPFGRNLAVTFIRSLHDNGMNVVAQERVNAKTSDFNQQLGHIRTKNPDLVFFAGLGAQAAILARSMRRMQIHAPLMAADGTVGPLFIELAGADGDGTLGLAFGSSEDRMPGWKSFEKKYRARHSDDIERFAPFAYDAAQVLAAAIQAAGTTDGRKLADALHAIRYQGLTGTIAFDNQGNLLNATYTMYVLAQGKWMPVRSFGGTR
ncbi:branched-chain amino acid ABC transporter substrate-binding protein [Herbaspirillum sp.]|uniref:branched-chain amino acid ABC transporter substrate-binding protein n=1 Tax=Herbaspirillum sp. TaxID=1890675 RepID=UPI001AFF6AD9|nr:branched-chain amino acid ABC transporter substrate-binding protein [Herbaspirillum sp.]MBO9536811.1 branched-chain amino acid ABC transporter substrate-binding protein [Herbaspirillum sp.]